MKVYFKVSQRNKFSTSIGSLPACYPISWEELEKVHAHSGIIYPNWHKARIGASSVCSYFRDYYKLPYKFYVEFYAEDNTFLTSEEL